MNPVSPIEIDGHTYDRYTASLSLMVRHLPGGGTRTSVNVSLVPTRIDGETGDAIMRPDHVRALRTGDALAASPDVAATVTAIIAAGQEFINGRGL